MDFLGNTLGANIPPYLSTKTEKPTSTDSWLSGITESSIYSDFLKPYAQKELGITEEDKKQNEANVQAYNDIKQNARPTTYGGFTPTQLAIGGAGILALIFIMKR